jgi:hypothetical protein
MMTREKSSPNVRIYSGLRRDEKNRMVCLMLEKEEA